MMPIALMAKLLSLDRAGRDRPVRSDSSEDLEQARRALTAAAAHGDDGIFDAAALALDQRVAAAARAGHAERVAERAPAAVDVEPFIGHAERFAAIVPLHPELPI